MKPVPQCRLIEQEPEGGKRVFLCPDCKIPLRLTVVGKTINRDCLSPPEGPCRHFGNEVRREKCDTCGTKGQWTILVFKCGKFGECTSATRLPTVVGCCKRCPGYEPASKTIEDGKDGTHDVVQ